MLNNLTIYLIWNSSKTLKLINQIAIRPSHVFLISASNIVMAIRQLIKLALSALNKFHHVAIIQTENKCYHRKDMIKMHHSPT
jgi:hypothetical protein